ncbi:unnamed protein product [Prunus armeniaca]
MFFVSSFAATKPLPFGKGWIEISLGACGVFGRLGLFSKPLVQQYHICRSAKSANNLCFGKSASCDSGVGKMTKAVVLGKVSRFGLSCLRSLCATLAVRQGCSERDFQSLRVPVARKLGSSRRGWFGSNLITT